MPSPRESASKGQPSKKASEYADMAKVKKVSISKKAKAHHLSLSFDSCNHSGGQDSVYMSDPHSIGTWDAVRDVPPCEVNALGEPTGRFWEHMQSYLHDRGPWLFKWDLPWPHQDPETLLENPAVLLIRSR